MGVEARRLSPTIGCKRTIAHSLIVMCLCTGCASWSGIGEHAAPRLDCAGWVGKGLGDESEWAFVGDSVAVPVGDIELGRAGEPGSAYAGLTFAKFGLAIKGSSDVEVAVQSEDVEGVIVEWGPAEPDVVSSAVRFEGCGDSEEWLIFAGGAWVPEPGCYEFVVRVGDRNDYLKLGIGARC